MRTDVQDRFLWVAASVASLALAGPIERPAAFGAPPPFKPRKVTARVQLRPNGVRAEQAMRVHEAPADLPIVSAEAAPLQSDDLVLGVVVDGEAMAFPVRYLALSEVVNGRVGKTLLAPTW